jgi:folate-binding Fe-S cluster repair protein YgfZ
MKHRLALRKRVVRLQVEGPAPAPGTPVLDGELPIGALGSAAGEAALALMRIDRLEEAEQAGRGLTVGGVRVTRAPADFAGDGNAGGGL